MGFAKLTSESSPIVVMFDYNPKMIKVSRQMSGGQRPRSQAGGAAAAGGGASGGASGGSTPTIAQGTPQSKYDIQGLVITGPPTKRYCQELLYWMNPLPVGSIAGGAAAAGGGSNTASALPKLTFMWGSGFSVLCTLSSCQIEYKRFAPTGDPLRADVTLSLQEEPDQLPGTNPTSGGRPGRHIHLVSDGDNLQGISMRTYGSPGHWRAIADLNGIDDPMRVIPGRELYLPNADELLAMRTR